MHGIFRVSVKSFTMERLLSFVCAGIKLGLVHLMERWIMNKNTLTIIYDGDTQVVACCSRERGNRTKP